jgi:hypothetical protein
MAIQAKSLVWKKSNFVQWFRPINRAFDEVAFVFGMHIQGVRQPPPYVGGSSLWM